MTDAAAHRYLDDLKSAVAGEHPLALALQSKNAPRQRVYYTGLPEGDSVDINNVLQRSIQDQSIEACTVCMIENITTETIGKLGAAWHIRPDFFVRYAARPPGDSLWEDIMGNLAKANGWKLSRSDQVQAIAQVGNNQDQGPHSAVENHVDGVLPHLRPPQMQFCSFNFERRFDHDPGYYGWQANIRLSYYRVSEYLYLILVDPPVAKDIQGVHLTPSKLTLWVPYSQNRGGLCIPQLYERPHFSLFESLQSFLSHEWHMNVIFATKEAVEIGLFCHFLAASLWLTNLNYIDREIRRIAFRDIRQPNVAINNRLHDCRHDLSTLRSQVLMAKTWIMPEIAALRDSHGHAPAIRRVKPWAKLPLETFTEIYETSDELEHFLMDTFQLLMSSISVLDSQASIQEARRSSQLTILATIYVPLSFVTGIFGMNVAEFNDARLSVWVFVVTLVAVGMLTIAILWIVKAYKGYKMKRM